MSRFLHYKFFRRFSRFLHTKKAVIQNPLPTFRAILMSNTNKLFVSSQICSAAVSEEDENEGAVESGNVKTNIEEDLAEALEKGNAAILTLMEQLRDFVTVVSQEYRNCLFRQIEIIKKAENLGPQSETWDEVPKFRSLADELQHELNEYVTLFNTLGQMANEKSLVNFVGESDENLDVVVVKFKELEVIFTKEIEENKRVEKELLRVKRDMILNEISN